MTITPNTPITLQQFVGVKDPNDAFKVWTDIVQTEWKDNLVNQEVLGAPIWLPKETEIIGDNIPLEIPVIPGIDYVNLSAPSTAKPMLLKVVANIGTDYWGQLTFDIRDKKSSIEWSRLASSWQSGLFKRKLDNDNMVSMEILKNTALATGNYIINPVVGSKEYTKDDYYEASISLIDECDEIVSKRSDYYLGVPADKVKIITSYRANRNLIIGQNFISSANLSLEKYNNGQPGLIMGYDNGKTIYLGKKILSVDPVTNRKLYPKDYDFENCSALIYQLDTLKVWGHAYEDTWFPVNDYTNRYSKNWRMDGVVFPGFEALNLLVVNRAPTLLEINTARATLRTAQPGIYKDERALPDLTQAQVDAWNQKNDRWNTRIMLDYINGTETVSSTPLLRNSQANITVDLLTASNVRKLAITTKSIAGLSFDLESVKLYGIDSTKISIVPTAIDEISLTAVSALKSGAYLTIDVLRDNKKFGVAFLTIGADPAVKAKK